MHRMMAASTGAGSSGSRGVTVDAVTYGHDGVPLGAAKRQFNDLDGAVRSWKLGGSFYREPTPGAIELLAVDADGAGRWTDYSGAYFATAEDMAVNDQPGEPGPGTKAREAWASAHAELLRDEAFALAQDDSTTGREHTLMAQRQKLRADGEIGLEPLTVSGTRQVIADRDRSERLDDSAREARVYEARLEHLRGLPGLEPGSRESVLRGLQIGQLKEKIAEFGEAAIGRKLPEDVGVDDLTEDDLTSIYGPEDRWREPVPTGYHDDPEQIGA